MYIREMHSSYSIHTELTQQEQVVDADYTIISLPLWDYICDVLYINDLGWDIAAAISEAMRDDTIAHKLSGHS